MWPRNWLYRTLNLIRYPSFSWLVLASVGIHLVLLKSIFEIHFNSPIINGIKPIHPRHPPVAKRVILFVADGLRADKFFDWTNSTTSTYLRSVMENKGVWGYSESQVPTESRPGNIAIACGIPEDPSAITRGWKENPVDVDSVFNRSTQSWAWGSPDVVPMFFKGLTKDRFYFATYDHEFEDFVTNNLLELDNWVFDGFSKFIDEAYANETIKNLLHSDHSIFFFHFLTMDSLGHSLKPHSVHYQAGINNLDTKIHDIVKIIERFYGVDNQSAYIFTSDHGMTNWGSHGAGTIDETLCPFLAWGSGIRSVNNNAKYRESTSKNLENILIKQIDISVLISSLLSNIIPVNSLGSLPVDMIDSTDDNKSEMLITSALQLLEHAIAFEELISGKTLTSLIWLKQPLLREFTLHETEILNKARKLNQYQSVVNTTNYIQNIAMERILYYRSYDGNAVSVAAVLTFTGWISYLVLLVYESVLYRDKGHKLLLYHLRNEPKQIPKIYHLAFLCIGLMLIPTFVQGTPVLYSLNFILPVMLWTVSYDKHENLNKVTGITSKISFKVVLFSIGAIEILVLPFYYRWVLSVGIVSIGLLPMLNPLINNFVKIIWFLACTAMSCFPLLPVIGKESSVNLVTFSGILGVVVFAYLWKSKHFRNQARFPKLTWVQFGIILMAVISAYFIRMIHITHRTTAYYFQEFSWICLVAMYLIPFLGSENKSIQFQHIMMSLFPVYTLLSIYYELLFFICLCILLDVWVIMEEENFNKNKLSRLSKENENYSTDIRIAYTYLFLIIFSFFGTGNISSINSFDPVSVFCFVTVFSPFIMGSLLLTKIMIPFILVTSAFILLSNKLQVLQNRAFIIVMVLSDVMGIQFWFLVTNQGSWLEIGKSISHYVIVVATTIFILILTALCRILMNPKAVKELLKSKVI